MGEVVVSSFEDKEMVEVVEKEKIVENNEKECASSMVRWENFLPRTGLRVLLVEADDCTRQIISALLRKCSYKVASAPDGLKAWEVLKARPHNIDLILTEVELPSISGYALLTLIMEHEICKNIPVIMMSTHDSVSMVYKCMLRGAADFLVKPIRINELKNLWQHVWRRQSQLSRGGLGPQDGSVAQEKLEATAENNATSDRSSGSKACAPRQDKCIEKGSDAQSSCGKLDLEAESAYSAEVEDYPQPKQGSSPAADLMVQEHRNCGNLEQNLCTPESVAAGSDTAAYNGNNALDQDGRMEYQSNTVNLNLHAQASGNREVSANFSGEAIDLIGTFDKHSKRASCSTDGAHRFDSSPQLNLSLRRCFPGVLENKSSNEKQLLNHSNASAFSRYVNKTLHATDSTPNENKVSSSDRFFDNTPESNSGAKAPLLPYDEKVISAPVNHTKEVENGYRNSQELFPIPLPVRRIGVDVCASAAGYGPTVSPMVCTPSPSPSPSSGKQQMNPYYQFSVDVICGRQLYHQLDQGPRISPNQLIQMQDQKFESLEDRTQFSCAADQSASSSLCNDAAGNLNSSDGGNEQSHVTHDLVRQRSLQREAALNKFRLKRKERCFEKKVRYESRKKLAEKRPRIKGQFVRQVPPDPPPPKSDNSGGN